MLRPFVHHFALLLLLASVCSAFDHEYAGYAAVLQADVKGGLVDYASLKQNRAGLDRFVEEIKSVTEADYKSWTREQQLAFWINVYNAWMCRIVIDHYPIHGDRMIGFLYPENSVQRITGIWDGIRLGTAGREVSLNDIEHKILRPVFHEPRIHFAIVCASKGCPVLQNEPYRASALEQQLEASAHGFIQDPSKVRLNRAAGKLELSKIFNWFYEDFDAMADPSWEHLYGDEAGPVAFVSKHVASTDAAFLKSRAVKIGYFDYDWSLNEKK